MMAWRVRAFDAFPEDPSWFPAPASNESQLVVTSASRYLVILASVGIHTHTHTHSKNTSKFKEIFYTD